MYSVQESPALFVSRRGAQALKNIEEEVLAAEASFAELDRQLGAPAYQLTRELELLSHEQRMARLVSQSQALRRELGDGSDAELAEEAASVHTFAYLVWMDMHIGIGEGRLRKRHRGEIAPIRKSLERAMQTSPLPHRGLAARLRETLVRADELLPLLDECLIRETEQLVARIRTARDRLADKYLLFPVLASLSSLPQKTAEDVRRLHAQITMAEWSHLCAEAAAVIDNGEKDIDAYELLLVLRLLAETPLRMDFFDVQLAESLLGLQQRIAFLAKALQALVAA